MASHYKLSGNGPWRILSQCPADAHNTMNAGLGRNGEHCICPRALELSRGIETGRRRAIPLWLAQGPWRIADECGAEIHNTISAARGVVKRGQYGTKCICPHALELMSAYRAREKERDAKKWQESVRAQDVAIRKAMKEMNMPDLSNGACLRKENLFAVDLGFNDERTPAAERDRARAKAVCDDCPLETFIKCQAWVNEEEEPRGAWGGIYAGRDVFERRGVPARMRRRSHAR